MKRNGKAILCIISLIFITVFFIFLVEKRSAEIKEIEKKLVTIQSERQKSRAQIKNGEKKIISREQIPSILEDLYKIAEENRLRRYDIISKSDKQPGLNIQGKEKGRLGGIEVYPLKISLEGDYRDVVEFIRELQNIKQMKKIREITISPEKGHIRAEINIDIFISGDTNAS